MFNVVRYFCVLIVFAWFAVGIPISNRSSILSTAAQLSRGYPKIDQEHLGYHYGQKFIATTKQPTGVNLVNLKEYYDASINTNPGGKVSSHGTKIYRPTGIIAEADGIVKVEIPTRPVQEVIEDKYQSSLPEKYQKRASTYSAGHVLDNLLNTQEHKKKQQDLAAQAVAYAITKLDFLVGNNGHNSPIHLPPSPVLALVLSKYGRYLPVTRGSRVYSYMATNNMHNSQPFGQYKWDCEDCDNIVD